jgi:hypothetical protein
MNSFFTAAITVNSKVSLIPQLTTFQSTSNSSHHDNIPQQALSPNLSDSNTCSTAVQMIQS